MELYTSQSINPRLNPTATTTEVATEIVIDNMIMVSVRNKTSIAQLSKRPLHPSYVSLSVSPSAEVYPYHLPGPSVEGWHRFFFPFFSQLTTFKACTIFFFWISRLVRRNLHCSSVPVEAYTILFYQSAPSVEASYMGRLSTALSINRPVH
jgi:hypothetical protein